MKARFFALALALVTLALPAYAQTVYKCLHPDTGLVEFTDEPCPEQHTSEEIEIQPGTVISSKQVYRDLERLEAEKAAQKKEAAAGDPAQPAVPDVHPAAGALNQINTLIQTLRAPFADKD